MSAKISALALRFVDFVTGLGTLKMTRAQRVMCAVAFDGAQPATLKGADLEAAAKLFGESVTRVSEETRKVFALVKGRRAGGSLLCALRALHLALTLPLGMLAAGEAGHIIFCGPDVRVPKQLLAYVDGALRAHPDLERMIVSSAAESLTLRRSDGRSVVFQVLPTRAGGSAFRGRSVVCAVMTEVGFMGGSEAAASDQEAYRSLLPALVVGAQMLVESSPWSEQGLLWELYRDNWGKSDADALVAHAPTLLMRDDMVTRSLVEREMRRDPDATRRESGAEFLEAGSGQFFSAASIRASIDETLLELTDTPKGWTAHVGIDLATVSDSSAIVVVHASDAEPRVVRVAEFLELRPKKGKPLALEEVIPQFCAIAARHGARVMHADHHLFYEAQRHLTDGVTLYKTPGGPRGKSESYLAVRNALNAGLLRTAPSHGRLRDQLSMVISTAIAGGSIQIRSPRRDGHGDLCSAAILAAQSALAGANVEIDWEWIDSVQRAAPAPVSGVGDMFGTSPAVHSNGSSWGGSGGWGMF